ncbi:hypothetical protein CCHOA_03085 [Corynebacterium choanae]|uniref:Uncharacterized protein n=1 Tax=Corynebacterium choanae TaxID=1862358 RepID=A0A3G6J9A5_9CORY|nr:hypothetical protein CCHOA_03085 [Corynebacterium choanae]
MSRAVLLAASFLLYRNLGYMYADGAPRGQCVHPDISLFPPGCGLVCAGTLYSVAGKSRDLAVQRQPNTAAGEMAAAVRKNSAFEAVLSVVHNLHSAVFTR